MREIGQPYSLYPNKHEVYLQVHPDRYGRFGHQTSSIFTGIALAVITGSKLLVPRYMFFAEKWNKEFLWEESEFVANTTSGNLRITYMGTSQSDYHGNNAYDLNQTKNIREVTEHISRQSSGALVAHSLTRPTKV